MHLHSVLFLVAIVASSLHVQAQNTRIKDRNHIGWWTGSATFQLKGKWGIHSEYQWRRENFVINPQQGLLRMGLNYQCTPKIQLRFGYAWIETFDYGDYPINAFGKDFTEFRIFQMAAFSDKAGRVDLSHRFMFEQRWIGRYTTPELGREDNFLFVNRMRYMFRIQCPLQGPVLDNNELYASAYNEIFIGFGKNVNENVFDQNRLGLLLGYRFNKNFRMEGGFFNQILQLPREILLQGQPNPQNVFQYNTGFIVNTFLTIQRNKQ